MSFDPHQYPSVEAATLACFSEQGPLRQKGFDVRESQRQLALMTARMIDSSEMLAWSLGEAPCGTGKGIAYLIPGVIAALRSEREWNRGKRYEGETSFRKLVVSTANIALQGQLINKDIPGVADILGIELRSALYKGRNNFLCLSKLQEEGGGLITDPGVRRLLSWSQTPGCSGDREDLTWDPGYSWSKVSVTSEECHGKKCAYYRPKNPDHLCFAERSRIGMENAHVVIVNHYLLARSPKPIPSVCLAVDEGHELEDAIRKSYSYALSDRSIGGLQTRIQRVLGGDRAREVADVLEELFLTMGVYLEGKNVQYAEVLPAGWHRGTFLTDKLEIIRKAAQGIGGLSRQASDENEAGKLEKLADQIDSLYLKAWSFAEGSPHPEVTGGDHSPWAIWADIKQERSKLGGFERKITAQMAPADISPRFQGLQRSYPKGVITSATLAVDGGFTYLRNTLGMAAKGQPAEFGEIELPVSGRPGETIKVRRQTKSAGPIEELLLPSPYDLAKMGGLIVPSDVLNPKDARWASWALQKVIEAVELAKGRTLVLASSYRMMEQYGFALEQRSAYPVRVQGSAGRNELIRWFTETTEGVLVATRSFFQGLDVQGESLSCVIIDRVPFDPPGDPLEEAVSSLLASKTGGNPFSVRDLPKTCMVLAQASGRLIRSQQDRGVVVCLDAKVVTGSMAALLRRSFGSLPLSREMEDIRRVIEGQPIALPQLRAGTIRRIIHA